MSNVLVMTIASNGIERELASTIQIGMAFSANGTPVPPTPDIYKAVWDTGETTTCITQKLADTLQLEQIGSCMTNGATGMEESRTFLISLYLPNGIVIPEIEVSDCTGDIGCDVLVGMDVICAGDMTISNFGRTVFSFRTPSIGELSL